MRDMKDVHTKTGPPHSLRSVATWTRAVVAASGVLTDLIVSALMGAISALIDVYSTKDAEVNDGAELKSLPVLTFYKLYTSVNALWLNNEYWWILTYTCPIGTFGHTIGAQVNTGVTTPCVFTLLI